MNKLTRFAVALPLLAAFLIPGISSAQSVSQLQAQINALLAEVQQLESQLSAKFFGLACLLNR